MPIGESHKCYSFALSNLLFILHCSWEPEANLESCQRLLASFWEHIGVDDKDYKPGTILEAKPEWIG